MQYEHYLKLVVKAERTQMNESRQSNHQHDMEPRAAAGDSAGGSDAASASEEAGASLSRPALQVELNKSFSKPIEPKVINEPLCVERWLDVWMYGCCFAFVQAHVCVCMCILC